MLFISNKLPFDFRHVPHDVIEVLLLTSVLSLLVTKHMCVSLRLHVAGPHVTVPIVKFNEKKATKGIKQLELRNSTTFPRKKFFQFSSPSDIDKIFRSSPHTPFVLQKQKNTIKITNIS